MHNLRRILGVNLMTFITQAHRTNLGFEKENKSMKAWAKAVLKPLFYPQDAKKKNSLNCFKWIKF